MLCAKCVTRRFQHVPLSTGLCCIISEVLMIVSIYVFEKKEDPSAIVGVEPLSSESSARAVTAFTSVTAVTAVAVTAVTAGTAVTAVSAVSAVTSGTAVVRGVDASVAPKHLSAEATRHSILKPTLSATVHHLHALVVTVLVVNMQHLPFLGIVPVFFCAGMGVRETLLHWFAACTSIGLYTLAFAFFKAR